MADESDITLEAIHSKPEYQKRAHQFLRSVVKLQKGNKDITIDGQDITLKEMLEYQHSYDDLLGKNNPIGHELLKRSNQAEAESAFRSLIQVRVSSEKLERLELTFEEIDKLAKQDRAKQEVDSGLIQIDKGWERDVVYEFREEDD